MKRRFRVPKRLAGWLGVSFWLGVTVWIIIAFDVRLKYLALMIIAFVLLERDLKRVYRKLLRDYYAGKAPQEVADWFVPKELPPLRMEVSIHDVKECDRETVRQWQHDPVFDLPDHLLWFQEATERFRVAHAQRVKLNDKMRQARWPFAYADAMMEERRKRYV